MFKGIITHRVSKKGKWRKNMSRIIRYMATTILIAIFCVGCSKDTSNKSDAAVQVEEDGKILVKYEEAFDKDYYDKDELEKAIDDEVAEFNDIYGKEGLEKDSFKVKKDIATLWYRFADAEKYIQYTNTYVKPEKKAKMYSGTYDKAIEDGIKFGGNFTKVGETGDITKSEFENTDELKVLFTNEEMCLYVPGEIVYINTNVTIDEDVVNTTASKMNYILYKVED